MYSSDALFLKNIFVLYKDFFKKSENKLKNWGLLIGILLLTTLNAYLFLNFVDGFAVMSEALSLNNKLLFKTTIIKSTALALSGAGLSLAQSYLTKLLKMQCQEWLTGEILEEYIGKGKYLQIARKKKVSNPGQVIEAEIDNITEQSLDLSIDFISNSINFIIFSMQLWKLGGAFTFVAFGSTIVIPGGLFWASFGISLLTILTVKRIGRSLAKLSQEQAILKAEYRNELEILDTNAESIAQEKGAEYFKASVNLRFKRLMNNYYYLAINKIMVESFQQFNWIFGSILPYILTAPLYFSGFIILPTMFQIGAILGQVQSTLIWFTNSFDLYSILKGSFNRVTEVQDALKENSVNPFSKIGVKKEVDNKISIRSLNIAIPEGTSILRGLNIEFVQGQHTLIKGRSGLGKSTLFKIISETWSYGEGDINIPKNAMTLPQEPTIPPNDTLKSILMYPIESNDLSSDENAALDKKLIAILLKVGLGKYAACLNEEKVGWGILSGGEKQLISFARALLHKPQWLFLDEATAKMDEETERNAYLLLKKELPDTTIISIGHRSSIEKFHQRIITLSKNEKDEVSINNRNTLFVGSNKPKALPRSNSLSCLQMVS